MTPADAVMVLVAETMTNVPFPVAKSVEDEAAFTVKGVVPAGVTAVVTMVSVVVAEFAPFPK